MRNLTIGAIMLFIITGLLTVNFYEVKDASHV